MIAVAGLVLGVMLMAMVAGWLTVRASDNGGWTDVFWTYGTGATLALAALAPAAGAALWRQVLIAVLVAAWSLRLGTYVAVRVAKGAEDARYVTLKKEWRGRFLLNMLGLALVQAPFTAVMSISVLYAARAPAPGFRVQDALGVAILVLAIAGEGLADRQMKQFKAEHKDDKDAVCDKGLWSWSRHPNYLFEALGWVAYPVIAIDPAHPLTLLSLVAPVAMGLLLRFGTGVPPLEAAMVRSRGDAYRRYQARVSAFLPRPPKSEEAST